MDKTQRQIKRDHAEQVSHADGATTPEHPPLSKADRRYLARKAQVMLTIQDWINVMAVLAVKGIELKESDGPRDAQVLVGRLMTEIGGQLPKKTPGGKPQQ